MMIVAHAPRSAQATSNVYSQRLGLEHVVVHDFIKDAFIPDGDSQVASGKMSARYERSPDDGPGEITIFDRLTFCYKPDSELVCFLSAGEEDGERGILYFILETSTTCLSFRVYSPT